MTTAHRKSGGRWLQQLKTPMDGLGFTGSARNDPWERSNYTSECGDYATTEKQIFLAHVIASLSLSEKHYSAGNQHSMNSSPKMYQANSKHFGLAIVNSAGPDETFTLTQVASQNASATASSFCALFSSCFASKNQNISGSLPGHSLHDLSTAHCRLVDARKHADLSRE